MAGKGAQNIVLVSRSASVTGKVKELAEDLSMMGVSVHVRRCNVVNETEVDELIRTGLQGLPPIRGIVLGTMVLHVSSVNASLGIQPIMVTANISL